MPTEITLANAYLDPLTGLRQSTPPPANLLVVEGTDFGTKPFSEPILQETFAGIAGQLLSAYDAEWVPYNGSGAEITDINPRFAGHKSAYNDPTRNPGSSSEFWTNYKTNLPRKGRSRFVSFWARVNYREDAEKTQIKFLRVSSTPASGGGGAYSGPGAHLVNAPEPKSWKGGWYDSGSTENGGTEYLSGAWYPDNRWVRIEYEIYLNDVDEPNGFFVITVDNHGTLYTSGIVQRMSGYPDDDFVFDTILLGLETANPETWVTPNVLLANTDYIVTVVKSGNTYIGTYNAGGTVPTAAQIIDGIKTSILADGIPPADVRTNPANPDEIGFHYGAAVTYTSNFDRATPISVQQGETYVDDDYKQFYLADDAVWSAKTEAHPQPYNFWSNTKAGLLLYFGGITGRKWLHKKLLPNTTPTLVGEVVPKVGGGWEVIYA